MSIFLSIHIYSIEWVSYHIYLRTKPTKILVIHIISLFYPEIILFNIMVYKMVYGLQNRITHARILLFVVFLYYNIINREKNALYLIYLIKNRTKINTATKWVPTKNTQTSKANL